MEVASIRKENSMCSCSIEQKHVKIFVISESVLSLLDVLAGAGLDRIHLQNSKKGEGLSTVCVYRPQHCAVPDFSGLSVVGILAVQERN